VRGAFAENGGFEPAGAQHTVNFHAANDLVGFDFDGWDGISAKRLSLVRWPCCLYYP
jgi:hypothetical protein